jgi:hypothetical protein
MIVSSNVVLPTPLRPIGRGRFADASVAARQADALLHHSDQGSHPTASNR